MVEPSLCDRNEAVGPIERRSDMLFWCRDFGWLRGPLSGPFYLVGSSVSPYDYIKSCEVGVLLLGTISLVILWISCCFSAVFDLFATGLATK